MLLPAFPDALPPGTPLRGGDFVLEEVLGRGGFAITYAARDTVLGRGVALKEFFPPGCAREGQNVMVPPALRADFERDCAEFAREGRALARFAQRGIVGVFGAWDEGGTSYLALQKVGGETLLARIEREGALEEAEVVEIARQVGDALATVHAAGLLHRDVTPGNVICGRLGRAESCNRSTAT